jgi:hypothetical protein
VGLLFRFEGCSMVLFSHGNHCGRESILLGQTQKIKHENISLFMESNTRRKMRMAAGFNYQNL